MYNTVVVVSTSSAVLGAHLSEAAPAEGAAAPAPAPPDDADVLDDHPRAGEANSKEKTPMCLVNELARYNKVILYIF